VWCKNCNTWEDRTRYFSKHHSREINTNHSKGEDLPTSTSTPPTISTPAATDFTSQSPEKKALLIHLKRKGGLVTNSTTSSSKDSDNSPIDIMNASSSESEGEMEPEINSDDSCSVIDAQLVTNILKYLRRKQKLKRGNGEIEHENKRVKVSVNTDTATGTDIKQMLDQVCTLITENMNRESEIVSLLSSVQAQLSTQSAKQDSIQSINQSTQQIFKSLDASNDSFEPNNL